MQLNFQRIHNKINSLCIKNFDQIEALKKVNSFKGLFWVLITLTATIAILKISCYIYSYNSFLLLILYPFLVFVIAGRQGAFLQLVHEAAHTLICTNKKLNDFIGNWICGAPIGMSMTEYRKDHGKHHNHANTKLDAPADLEKYTTTDVSSSELRRLFLKDIFGISAIKRVLGMQQKNIGNKQKKVINNFLVLLTSQIIIFLILNHSLFLYLILWIIPLFTANMFLMRVRGIAEHGMPSQLDIIPEDGVTGNILTRTLNSKHSSTNFLTKCIENVLIGTLSIKYHLEHHLVPNVPHYNLQKLHKILNLYSIDELRNNYKSGYFSALFQFNKT